MLLFNRGLGQGQPVEGVLDPHVAARVIPAAAGYDAGLSSSLVARDTWGDFKSVRRHNVSRDGQLDQP